MVRFSYRKETQMLGRCLAIGKLDLSLLSGHVTYRFNRLLATHEKAAEVHRYGKNIQRPYPLADISWATVMTTNATFGFHTQSNGLAMAMRILNGTQYLVVSRGRDDDERFGYEARHRTSYVHQYSTELGDEERLEGVLLERGTTL